MTRRRLTLLILWALGLIVTGIVAGMLQTYEGSDSGQSYVLLIGLPFIMASLLLVLIAGWAFLVDRFPSGQREQDPRDRLLLGVLSHLPLAVGIVNSAIQPSRLPGVDVPLALLNGIALPVAFWFIYYCIQDLVARRTPATTTVAWVIGLVLGNLIAIPVYWWLYLRCRPVREMAPD